MRKLADRTQLRHLFFVLIGLFLILQFRGETTHAATLQQSTVSIQMSDPTCDQVLSTNGACSIQIDSLTVFGSGPALSRVELLLNGKLRVYMDGFFESSAYLAHQMMPGGLAVACGRPNDGGLANYGKSYSITANAYMADGSSATDSATIYCPAFDGKIYAPLVRKK
jgi:hypothetical protein